jgi:threonine/homoserine/homoserine lactone efflux protein
MSGIVLGVTTLFTIGIIGLAEHHNASQLLAGLILLAIAISLLTLIIRYLRKPAPSRRRSFRPPR